MSTYQSVLAATRKYVATNDRPYIETHDAYKAVIDDLGIDIGGGKRSYQAEAERTRLWDQVARALNALVAEHVLAKIGKGAKHPNGASHPTPAFYTPDRLRAAVEQAAQDRDEAAKRRRRWEDVWDRWAALSLLEELGPRGERIKLDLDDQEHVLDMIEGRA